MDGVARLMPSKDEKVHPLIAESQLLTCSPFCLGGSAQLRLAQQWGTAAILC